MALSKSRTRTVFVIGAGVSVGFGYPLTSNLFFSLWEQLPPPLQKRLKKIVEFHHPRWDGRPATLPDMEEFLTELAANQDLLEELRPKGPFNPASLKRRQEDLLLHLGRWFHSISESKSPSQIALLRAVAARLRTHENPVIVSFNWDYELDREVAGDAPDLHNDAKKLYGLGSDGFQTLAILKPHGSLNWYLHSTARHIKPALVTELWPSSARPVIEAVDCFTRWREPITTRNRRYVPWIVPPTHMKSFQHPMLKHVWSRCVEALSTAERVYFLGYSLPAADWHARYIIRCGFHNQIEGMPLKTGPRAGATGAAKVFVINPDSGAFRRIESVVGGRCRWVPKTIAQWMDGLPST